jgi:hypothetical protein
LDLVGWNGTAVGFAAAGWALLRMKNDAFDLPPDPQRWSLERAEILRHINRILLKHSKIDYLERSDVGGCQHYGWSYPSLVRLQPALRNHAPPVARLQARKAERWRRRDQVVADAPLLRQEFRSHHCAHQMNGLIWSRSAATIAIEAGNRVRAAVLQFVAEDVHFTLHNPSLAWPAMIAKGGPW